jgi:hypothetical protein
MNHHSRQALIERLNKQHAELREAKLLLEIAAKDAVRHINRFFGAFIATGAQFGEVEQHNAEGGKTDERC